MKHIIAAALLVSLSACSARFANSNDACPSGYQDINQDNFGSDHQERIEDRLGAVCSPIPKPIILATPALWREYSEDRDRKHGIPTMMDILGR